MSLLLIAPNVGALALHRGIACISHRINCLGLGGDNFRRSRVSWADRRVNQSDQVVGLGDLPVAYRERAASAKAAVTRNRPKRQ